jgi:hypothetical protein
MLIVVITMEQRINGWWVFSRPSAGALVAMDGPFDTEDVAKQKISAISTADAQVKYVSDSSVASLELSILDAETDMRHALQTLTEAIIQLEICLAVLERVRSG